MKLSNIDKLKTSFLWEKHEQALKKGDEKQAEVYFNKYNEIIKKYE